MAYELHGDDVVFPMTGNEDLIAAGLSPEHDDDDHGPYSLFAEDVGHETASIDLDADVAGAAAPATGMTVDSNTPTMTNNIGINGTTSTAVSGKHKSKCWADFEEIYETINGNQVRVQAICKLCRTTYLGTKILAGKNLTMLLGFSHDLLLILMVLCITGTMILLLLELSCGD
jgi:hypothetical protein